MKPQIVADRHLNIHPLFPVCPANLSAGKASKTMPTSPDCKSEKTGSIPVPASRFFNGLGASSPDAGKSLNNPLNIRVPFGVRSNAFAFPTLTLCGLAWMVGGWR
jgi:hypothetical protein